jgi:hypothetical protein
MSKQGVRINAAAWQPTTQAASQGIFSTRPFPEMSQQEHETAGKGEKTAPTVSRPSMIENINRSMARNPIPASNVGIVGVQAKLTIGEPGDQYEQEADKVAAEVVQKMNAPEVPPITAPPRGDGEDKSIQRKPLIPIIASMPAPREDIYRKGQLKAPNVPDLQADFEKQLNQARGGGRPLDAAFRAKIEPAMGADFGGVRVHTDSSADQMSQSIQAKAFTTGQDVFFRQGAYDPGSRGGQELIAHELTHVVQQSGGMVQRNLILRTIDMTEAEVIKPGPPATLKKDNWYYKIFAEKAQAQEIYNQWNTVEKQGIPVPEYQVKEVDYDGRRQWAFRSKQGQGTFFQLSKPGHLTKVQNWINQQTSKKTLERLRKMFEYARNNMGDTQGFLGEQDTIIFIDINTKGTSPNCDDVVNYCATKLSQLAQ